MSRPVVKAYLAADQTGALYATLAAGDHVVAVRVGDDAGALVTAWRLAAARFRDALWRGAVS